MKKKQLLSMVLAGAMVAGMLTGCGNTKENTAGTGSTTQDTASGDAKEAQDGSDAAGGLDISEPVTLKWYLHGSNVKDDSAVMEKVNEYLGEKLNVTLEPIWGTWGDFDEGSTMAINGGCVILISGNRIYTVAVRSVNISAFLQNIGKHAPDILSVFFYQIVVGVIQTHPRTFFRILIIFIQRP